MDRKKLKWRVKGETIMKLPKVETLLKAGCHFGHLPSKTHPKMKDFVWGVKKGIQIIDLDKTYEQLKLASDYLSDLVAKGGTVLFVSTKPQIKEKMMNTAKELSMPYMVERWIGGLFTNYRNVIKTVKKLKELRKKAESGELEKYTKKEQVMMRKELDKLEKLVGGLENMRQLPDAIFVIDVKNDKTAVVEANRKSIPVVAVCDTNNKPTMVDYIIPANDDAVSSIDLLLETIQYAIKDGLAKRKVNTKVLEAKK